MKPNRFESLDYLRGIMAFSVMVYHYATWARFDLDSGSLLSKLGIYAVSIFYILSGLSLSIVYRNKISSAVEVGQFFIRRLFRIVPLFWISIFSALMLKYFGSALQGEQYQFDLYQIFLNVTLLFGFFQPDAYLSTGAWSIGNEMVFYAILPIIFLLTSRYSWVFPVMLIISIILGVIFAILFLDPEQALIDQWVLYINPFNQIFLFLGGVAIGTYSRPVTNVFGSFIAITAFIVFLLFPVSGDRIQLVTGSARLCLSLACLAFVWATYITSVQFEGVIAKALSFLGKSCYSIYLMHPLVAVPIVFILKRLGFSIEVSYCLSAVGTLLISWITFRFIETPMMRMGSKFAQSMQVRRLKLA